MTRQVDGGAVLKQAAIPGEIDVRGYRRKPIAAGPIRDLLLMQAGEAIVQQQEPAIGLTRKSRDGAFDIGISQHRSSDHLYAERRRGSVKDRHEEFEIGSSPRIEHDCNPLKVGSDLLQQIEPFATK